MQRRNLKSWIVILSAISGLWLVSPLLAQEDAASGLAKDASSKYSIYLPLIAQADPHASAGAADDNTALQVMASAASAQPVPVSTATTVGSTDDLKGLGYPDSRKVAQDTQGNPVIAYRKKSVGVSPCPTTANYHIFVARKTANLPWPAERVDNGVCPTQRVPSLTIDSQNKVLVTWYGQITSTVPLTDRQIFYAQSTAVNSWSTPAVPSPISYPAAPLTPELWQEHPVIYANPGSPSPIDIIWESRDTVYQNASKSRIRFTKSANGTAWVTTVLPTGILNPATGTLSPNGNFSRPTVMSTQGGSKLFALAYVNDGSSTNIAWIKSADDGQTWLNSSANSANNANWEYISKKPNEQKHVSAAVDTAFRVHAVWRQVDAPGSYKVYYSVYNGSWLTTAQPLPVGNANTPYQLYPSVTVYKVGTSEQVAVAWLETKTLPSDEEVVTGTVYYLSVGCQPRMTRRPGHRHWRLARIQPTSLVYVGAGTIQTTSTRFGWKSQAVVLAVRQGIAFAMRVINRLYRK
jgi:hypothetical protein